MGRKFILIPNIKVNRSSSANQKEILAENETEPVKGLSLGEIPGVTLILFRLPFKADALICFLMIHEPDQLEQVLNQIPEIKQQAE